MCFIVLQVTRTCNVYIISTNYNMHGISHDIYNVFRKQRGCNSYQPKSSSKCYINQTVYEQLVHFTNNQSSKLSCMNCTQDQNRWHTYTDILQMSQLELQVVSTSCTQQRKDMSLVSIAVALHTDQCMHSVAYLLSNHAPLNDFFLPHSHPEGQLQQQYCRHTATQTPREQASFVYNERHQ